MAKGKSRVVNICILLHLGQVNWFCISTEVTLSYFLGNESKDGDIGIKLVSFIKKREVLWGRQFEEKSEILKYNGKDVPSI